MVVAGEAKRALVKEVRSALWIGVIFIVTLLSLPLMASSAGAVVNFSAGELLGKPTATSITVNAVPTAAVDMYYEYGTSSGSYTSTTATVSVAANQAVEITISSLSPNTRYYYRMRYQENGVGPVESRPEGTFHTQRANGSDFRFVVQSDAHLTGGPGTSTAVFGNAVNNMAADAPDFLIDLGDMFETKNSESQVRAEYLDMRSWLEPITANAAVFLAIGNHENEEGWIRAGSTPNLPIWSANARKEYFANPVSNGFYTGDTTNHSGLGVDGDGLRETYYAWEWGDALFVVIDPFWNTTSRPHNIVQGADPVETTVSGDRWDWTLGLTQYLWLEQTLASSSNPYTFIFTHHLVGGTGGYGRGGGQAVDAGYEWGAAPATLVANRSAAWSHGSIHDILVDNDVTAVFHGHDHCYSTETRDGVVYQETPMPGAAGPGSNLCGNNYTTTLDNSGHLRVDVGSSQTTVAYVSASTGGSNGAIADSYTMSPTGGGGGPGGPPTADAGPDQMVVDTNSDGEDVSLDGTGSSDPGGTITTYEWSESGSVIATGSNPLVNLDLGTHIITLEVTDNDLNTDTDTVTITVNAPGGGGADYEVLVLAQNAGPGGQGNVRQPDGTRFWISGGCRDTLEAGGVPVRVVSWSEMTTYPVSPGPNPSCSEVLALFSSGSGGPPTADAGPDQTVIDADGGGESVTFDGTGSFDQGTGVITTYEWSESGSVIATGINPSVTLPVGVHVITLEITDDDLETDTKTVTITIDSPPTAEAGLDQTVHDPDGGGESVTLDGSASSDPAPGVITGYEWSASGSVIATGATPSFTLAVGVHVITLEVTDDDLETDTDSVTITVNAAPTADAGPDQTVTDTDGGGDESVTLDGSASTDPAPGSVSIHEWSESGSVIATGAIPAVTLGVGTHVITLEVTDNDGATDTDTITIDVTPAGLTADAGPDQTVHDYDGGGESVTLDGTGSSDPGGSIDLYEWSELGSVIASGATPAVTLGVGTHVITLEVTDNELNTATDTVTVTVNAAPTADAGADQIVLDADGGGDESVALDGTASTDVAPGSITGYEWSESGSVIASGATPAVTLGVGVGAGQS